MTVASAHDAYLESKVLTAEPMELVRILYRLAMDRTREAIRHLETGDVESRTKAICAASQVLAELSRSLDFEAGGEISQRLAMLYQYMQFRLVDANFQKRAEPLNEILSLLNTLAEAWQAARPETQAPPQTHAGPWQEEAPEEVTAGWCA